jgi:hypothetical protein
MGKSPATEAGIGFCSRPSGPCSRAYATFESLFGVASLVLEVSVLVEDSLVLEVSVLVEDSLVLEVSVLDPLFSSCADSAAEAAAPPLPLP